MFVYAHIVGIRTNDYVPLRTFCTLAFRLFDSESEIVKGRWRMDGWLDNGGSATGCERYGVLIAV